MKIVKRFFLKSRDIRRLEDDVYSAFHVKLSDILPPKTRVEVAKAEKFELFLANRRPILLRREGVLIPTLLFGELLSLLPRVVIDVGAIPFICRGADVMAPGIVRIQGEFDEGSAVTIVEERHQKPLAIAIATVNSEEMKKLKKGKVLMNIHYVGDDAWKAFGRL